MEQLFKRIEQLILLETNHDNNTYRDEILKINQLIADEWIKDYSLYRKYIPNLLSIAEKYFDKYLSYSIHIYKKKYVEVLKLPIKNKFDPTFINVECTDHDFDQLKELLENSIKAGSKIRISDFDLNTEKFSEVQIKGWIGLYIHKLQNDSIKSNWDIEQVETTSFELACLRTLCLKIQEPEIFYYATNMFFDRLFTSEYYQDARNICEEILMASIKDDFLFYGYFSCFRAYSNQGNIHAALIYGNLFLSIVINSKYLYSDNFSFEIIFQSFKLFRNCHLYPDAIQVYESVPNHISLSTYQKHSLDSSYFNCRIGMKDSTVTEHLSDYLNKERESIISKDSGGYASWLMILYNLKRRNDFFDFDNSGLELYLNLFENMSPPEMTQKLRDILFGTVEELKGLFKNSLLKLTRTNSKADFVYDNDMAMKIANRLVHEGFARNDNEAILLSMLLKSDYSLNLTDRQTKEIDNIDLNEFEQAEFYQIYDSPIENLKNLPLDESHSIIWFVCSEDNLYQMTYNDDNFSFNQFDSWSLNDFITWSEEKVPDFNFDPALFQEDHIHRTKGIINEIPFPALFETVKATRILVIKDMNVSSYPHNLLLDKDNKFVHTNSSITNIVSLEWLSRKLKEQEKNAVIEKSIFLPIGGDDIIFDLLFDSIKDTLKKYEVITITSLNDELPISSTINIITSHGDKDITSTHVVFPDNSHVIRNLNGILGDGKILILLVCYSGSAHGNFFKNEVTSLTKRYLSSGYQAVVAPFWRLHIKIPPIWLPVFFDVMDAGGEISQAVFEANKSVYESYPTPVAWACMHLYGNPFYKIVQ